MPKGSSISLFTLIGVLCAFLTGAPALDETKYPDGKGQWVRAGGANAAPWDARKPSARKPSARKPSAHKPDAHESDAHESDAHESWGLGQQPPLAPQYQALFDANLKQLAASVKAGDPTTSRIPPRDAARDDGDPSDGDRRHAGHDLHHDRDLLDAVPDLHGWAGVAEGASAVDDGGSEN